jgi:Sigma-70 region 2
VNRNAQPISEPCGLTIARLARLSDEEAMARVQAGHDDALAVLFDRYHRLVVSIAFKILRDIGEAEDVTQVVFNSRPSTLSAFLRAVRSTYLRTNSFSGLNDFQELLGTCRYHVIRVGIEKANTLVDIGLNIAAAHERTASFPAVDDRLNRTVNNLQELLGS